ncbi:MAG: hypothetical protein ACOCZE_11240, partial [Planctomycetota bacterium]
MLRLSRWMSLVIAAAFAVSCQTATVGENPRQLGGAKPASPDITGRPFQQPKVSSDTFQAQVMLVGLLPRSKDPTNFELLLTRAAGQWRQVGGKAYNYNRASHPVKDTGLEATENGLTGTVHITIHPDAWVPADGKKREIDVTLQDVRFADQAGPDGQRPITGNYSAVIAHPDGQKKNVTGKVVGTAAPFRLPGAWTAGQADGDGIAFAFDMGTKRVNWNHLRCAVQELPEVADLRDFGGIECVVTTAAPRDDANVTLWIREHDGSWYYCRSAVPLIDKTNSARIEFTDFAEAEWVAPGSHIDEDYEIDLARISHVAVGVVNPLGIGKVNFTLQKLTLLDKPDKAQPPVAASCTGRMLSINDHNVVPAPLFGGFAGNMPQQYRPGCQRNLYAQSYPRNPWQDWYKFNTHEFVDWKPLMEIFAGKTDRHAALVKHLHQRARGGEFRSRFEKFNLEKHLKGKDRHISPRELRSFLDTLLRVRDLYQAKAFEGYDLPDKLVANLKRPDRDDVEVYHYNRRLLEAVFSKHIKPVGDHGPAEMFYIECY